MKINVNAFIAVILCAALLSGLWVLSNSRDELETNIWSPRAIYEHVGGSSYVSPELPTYSSRSSSDDVVVKMSPSRTMSRRVSSVPYGLIASSPYGLIPSSSYGLAASSPHGLITYASSNATYHSFGGGGDMSGGMSGGSFRANPEAMPAAAALSVPSMPNYAMASRSAYVAPQQQADLAAVSAISEAASAYDMPMRSSITSIGGQLYQVGSSGLTYSTSGSRHSINGRLNAPPTMGGGGASWDNWLQTLGTEQGLLYTIGDQRYYDMDLLKQAFEAAIASGNMPGVTWDEFLAQYFYADGQNTHFQPLGEPWILLLLAALLVVIQRRRLAKP